LVSILDKQESAKLRGSIFLRGEAMDLTERLKDNRIQEILDKRGMSQQDLADLINEYFGKTSKKLYQSDISDIIKGKAKRLTFVRVAQISIVLGYSVEAIWPSMFR
jgi:hypothetical protein